MLSLNIFYICVIETAIITAVVSAICFYLFYEKEQDLDFLLQIWSD